MNLSKRNIKRFWDDTILLVFSGLFFGTSLLMQSITLVCFGFLFFGFFIVYWNVRFVNAVLAAKYLRRNNHNMLIYDGVGNFINRHCFVHFWSLSLKDAKDIKAQNPRYHLLFSGNETK